MLPRQRISPCLNGDDSLVPPLSSTSEDWPLRLTQPAKVGLASQDAKLRSPGATMSTVPAFLLESA